MKFHEGDEDRIIDVEQTEENELETDGLLNNVDIINGTDEFRNIIQSDGLENYLGELDYQLFDLLLVINHY